MVTIGNTFIRAHTHISVYVCVCARIRDNGQIAIYYMSIIHCSILTYHVVHREVGIIYEISGMNDIRVRYKGIQHI